MSDNELKKTKSRSKNYTDQEEEILVKLANKYKNVVENKTTSAQSMHVKKQTWQIIAEEFNAQCPLAQRSALVLRSKYDNIKKLLRQSKAKERADHMATGGGKAPEPSEPKNEALAELAETIALSIEGRISLFDDDAEPINQSIVTKEKCNETDTELNNNYTISDSLHILDDGEITFVDELTNEQLASAEFVIVPTLSDKQSALASSSGKQSTLASSASVSHSPILSTSSKTATSRDQSCSSCLSSTAKKQIMRWTKHTPASLKTSKSAALKSNRSQSHDDTYQARDELFDLKKQILRRELELIEQRTAEAKEEHQLRMDIMRGELENNNILQQRAKESEIEHKARLAILRVKLTKAKKHNATSSPDYSPNEAE